MNFLGKMRGFSFWKSEVKGTGGATALICACFLQFHLTARADDLPEATNVWTFSFGTVVHANIGTSTPAVAPDGTVYVGVFDGHFYALNTDGTKKWSFNVNREIQSSPAIADDGTIYFGSRDWKLYALTPAGKLKWKFATGGWVDSSPAIAADGTIYFGSWDKNFYALNPDGSLKWKFNAGGIVDSSPAIAADGTIYFGAHNFKFFALDPQGRQRWTFSTEAENTSSPAIGSDGDVYFSSTDGNLYRLKSTGSEVWRCRIGGGGNGSPVLAENGNIFIAAAQRDLIVSAAGAIIWHSERPGWIDETPAGVAGMVCFSFPWRQLVATKPDGTGVWVASTQDNLSSSPVIDSHGEIYCSCGHYLRAFQPPMPLSPSQSSWPMFRANSRHTGRVGGN